MSSLWMPGTPRRNVLNADISTKEIVKDISSVAANAGLNSMLISMLLVTLLRRVYLAWVGCPCQPANCSGLKPVTSHPLRGVVVDSEQGTITITLNNRRNAFGLSFRGLNLHARQVVCESVEKG